MTLARLHRVSASFLVAISEPEHPDHEDLLEWVGGRFDGTAFDLEAVNRRCNRSKGGGTRRLP